MVARLTRTMAALWVVASLVFAVRGQWHALGVLTLTVAAVNVQLRWLASQVSGLVSMTLGSPDAQHVVVPSDAPAEVPGHARELADPETRVQVAGPLDSYGEEGHRFGTMESDRNLHDAFNVDGAVAEDAPAEFANSTSTSNERKPKTTAIVVLRPVILLSSLLILYTVGRSQPIALAVGALTLPTALFAETVLTASRSMKP